MIGRSDRSGNCGAACTDYYGDVGSGRCEDGATVGVRGGDRSLIKRGKESVRYGKCFPTHLITYQQLLGNPINSCVPQHHENPEFPQTQTNPTNN
ncbi:MAG: hypothetical protein ACYTXT_43510 [Nostoc sp.]